MTAHDNAQIGQALALTPREVEVLLLLAHGCTYLQVGDRLGVSVHTVTSHVKNAYRKLDVHSAAAAVMRAVELRLFSQPHDSPDSLAVLAGDAVLERG
jgi:DNA-binding CsgD family transcriptional regulator